MKSKVWFADARARNERESLIAKTQRLFEVSGTKDLIREGDIVAIKVHMGEWGNTRALRPQFIRAVVEKVVECGGLPFVTDTTTLYRGDRENAIKYLKMAAKNGYTQETLGAPIIIADGLRGDDGVKVRIDGPEIKEIEVARCIVDSDVMVVLTHFKGHEMSGFGGSIKNVAMGCFTKKSKAIQHQSSKPMIDETLCVGCGKCVNVCPNNAIRILENKARIDYAACTGCGECVTVCERNAIKLERVLSKNLQARMAECMLAIKKLGIKCSYFNFLLDITPHCDCVGWSDLPIVPDIGILCSLDPVAIDKASLDLVYRAVGIKGSRAEEAGVLEENTDKFSRMFGIDVYHQIEVGEKLGLGSSEYELIRI